MEELHTFEFELKMGTEVVHVTARVPGRDVPLAAIVPFACQCAEGLVGAAVKEVHRLGRNISCCAGCASCCRQPVPISEAEALYLADLVAAMPDDRREKIRARFDEAAAMLAKHGLTEIAPPAAPGESPKKDQQFGQRYLDLQIDCPFLDNAICTIHPQRPLACREYLVTSPAARCMDPIRMRAEVVEMPRRISSILYRFGDGVGEDQQRFMPLVMALEWAGKGPPAAARSFFAPELVENFIRQLGRASK